MYSISCAESRKVRQREDSSRRGAVGGRPRPRRRHDRSHLPVSWGADRLDLPPVRVARCPARDGVAASRRGLPGRGFRAARRRRPEARRAAGGTLHGRAGARGSPRGPTAPSPRREDFVDRGWPATFCRRAAQLAQQIDAELRAFSRRLCGREDVRTVRMVAYAVIESPFAAIRRHVSATEIPPPYVDPLIRATYEAVMDLVLRGDRS